MVEKGKLKSIFVFFDNKLPSTESTSNMQEAIKSKEPTLFLKEKSLSNISISNTVNIAHKTISGSWFHSLQ